MNMYRKSEVDQMELEPITCRGKVGYALDKSPAHCRCKDANTSQIYYLLTQFLMANDGICHQLYVV